MADLPRKLGSTTATLTMVASMIGTGVFTTTGFLVRDLQSPGAVLLAWLLGGVVSLCGALCYAELATALPHNGGEYLLLSRIYHPALGFLAGWVSLIVGFAAPAAAASLACARYLGTLNHDVSQGALATGLLLAVSIAHGLRVSAGTSLQNAATGLQLLLIGVLIAAGLSQGELARVQLQAPAELVAALASPEFAVGLIYVAFSYSGWNAAVYIVGELRAVQHSLPRACIAGTAVVTALYLLLNLTFLIAAPPGELAGKVEVGAVAAEHLFGQVGRVAVALAIAVGLLTTISALVMTGARVLEAMGRDHPRLARLGHRGPAGGGPARAIALQTAVSLGMVALADVDQLLSYCGFVLSLFAALTVTGVIVLRLREPRLPRPYRVPGYPLTPLFFTAVAAWMIVHALYARPMAALAGAVTLALGLLLYVVASRPTSSSGRERP